MFRTIMTSKTGMNANQNKLDAISNNLANSTTTGYKKINVGFKSLLQESLNRQGYPVNDKNSDMGTGVRATDWFRDGTQGDMLESDTDTDLALDGKGYFGVTLADGSKAYTRDGSFKIDKSGQLVDEKGNKVDIEFADGRSYDNTKLKEDNFMVKQDGNIYMNSDEGFIKIGTIPVYTAIGDQAFTAVGENLFVPSEGVQVERTTDINIEQGFLEGSNIDMSTEFTDMIVAQRAFQLSSKSLETADEMWGMINNMRK